MYCRVIMKCQLIMTGFKCGSIRRVADEHISHFDFLPAWNQREMYYFRGTGGLNRTDY